MFNKESIARLADLKDEALAALHSELVDLFNERRAGELSVSGVEELANISAALDSVVAEIQTRGESKSDLASKVNALVEKVASQDFTKSDEPVEPVTEEATAAVEGEELAGNPFAKDKAAADEEDKKDGGADEDEEDAKGKKKNPFAASALTPAGLESKDLPEPQHGTAVIVAAGDVPGISMGAQLPDTGALAEAFIARHRTLKGGTTASDGDQVIVASINADYPEDRRLDHENLTSNMAKIENVVSPDALTASGGLCAPLEPYYGIQVISAAHRPVRDGLPKFQATRGGVRFIPPPNLTQLTNAIGTTTAAQDVGPYPSPTPYKPCLHVTCGSETTTTITAISRCLTFGNFAARTYPEQVEAWLQLVMAAHARRAETLLLDAIGANSTAVTTSGGYSAMRHLLSQVDQAIAGYRSRQRTSPGLTFRVMMPDWTKQLLRADLARSWRGNGNPGDVYYVSDSQIEQWFNARGVNVSFYVDGATGANQVFGAQAGGAMTAFPSTVVWYLFTEGSFVFLDGGTLDLGLVRDSTLNQTNDYQIFAETFEGLVFYGVEALKVTSTVCPNGIYAPAATGSSPC